MRAVRWLLGSLATILPLATVAATAWWGWQDLQRPYQGWSGASQQLIVTPGTSSHQILSDMERAGLISRAGLARLYLLYFLREEHLQAGEYRFSEPLTAPQALGVLVEGRVVTYPFTIIEGLTLVETATSIADQGFGKRETLIELMSSPELIADLDGAAEDLEGYLFPDTYSFPSGTSEAQIVAALVDNFRRQLQSAAPGAQDVRRLVTLASVVEKEAALDEERALIAGVYAHRLRIGMPLQADPTVIFALKKEGTWNGNLRRPDLAHPSPYNTYVHAGLPPGPICSPGRLSLAAAAAPTDTTHLYFVSRNDGSHVFADTLSEHNRNVHEWQKLYWQRRWAAERNN